LGALIAGLLRFDPGGGSGAHARAASSPEAPAPRRKRNDQPGKSPGAPATAHLRDTQFEQGHERGRPLERVRDRRAAVARERGDRLAADRAHEHRAAGAPGAVELGESLDRLGELRQVDAHAVRHGYLLGD
jgi:hypothetical protein